MKAGINLDLRPNSLNKHLQDVVMPEIPIVIPDLEIGTTIDNLVAHNDGTFSIVD